MRPKKSILIVDEDIERAGMMRFLLETHGYSATTAEQCRQAQRLINAQPFDLVILQLPMDELKSILSPSPWVRRCPSLALSDNIQRDIMCGASQLLAREKMNAAELIERVRVLSARKRGPRPGVKPVACEPAPGVEVRRSA